MNGTEQLLFILSNDLTLRILRAYPGLELVVANTLAK